MRAGRLALAHREEPACSIADDSADDLDDHPRGDTPVQPEM
jgi:hypothetical protein